MLFPWFISLKVVYGHLLFRIWGSPSVNCAKHHQTPFSTALRLFHQPQETRHSGFPLKPSPRAPEKKPTHPTEGLSSTFRDCPLGHFPQATSSFLGSICFTHGCGSKQFWYHFGEGAPPILEPISVGIGMFTGGTGVLTHSQMWTIV